MASENTLDQVVKGQPPPDVSPSQVAQAAKSSANNLRTSITAPLPPAPSSSSNSNDPRDALPSSPPQIYLNLLILESSLRLQYLSLRARLRVHLLLLAVLTAWVALFTYLLFFRLREDGSGVGGSVYWVVESAEKMGWCGGVVTLCLFWGTGMYERGVRWPRKFVGTTNRGLRGFNMKVVLVRGSFLGEMLGWLGMLDPFGWFRERKVNFQIVPRDIETGASKDHWNSHATRYGLIEEDVAPSGDVLKLLLLPKPFSSDFREGWENYRAEYWERENARRKELRKVVRMRQREVARREGGWLWWTGWRGWKNIRVFSNKTRRRIELEKLALKERYAVDRMKDKRRRLGSEPNSKSSSRSSTPGPGGLTDEKRVRRGSSSASTTRRPHKGNKPSHSSRLSATETILQGQEFAPKRLSTASDDTMVKMEDMDAKPKFADELRQEPEEA